VVEEAVAVADWVEKYYGWAYAFRDLSMGASVPYAQVLMSKQLWEDIKRWQTNYLIQSTYPIGFVKGDDDG
jgi:hypothetical protein